MNKFSYGALAVAGLTILSVETSSAAVSAQSCDMPEIAPGAVETCTLTDGISTLTKIETTITRDTVSPNVFNETGTLTMTFGGTGTNYVVSYNTTYDDTSEIDRNLSYTVQSGEQSFSGTCAEVSNTGSSGEPGCNFVSKLKNAEDGGFSGTLNDLENEFNSVLGFTSQPLLQTTEQVIVVQEEVQAVVTKEQTRSTNQIISNRISNAVGGFMRTRFRAQSTADRTNRTYAQRGTPATGLSAGDAPEDKGIWIDASKSFIDISRSNNRADGDSMTVLVGMDRFITQDILVGGLIGGLKSDVDLKSLNGNQQTVGTLFGAYAAYLINNELTLEGNATYTIVENDQERRTGGSLVTSYYDSDRYSFSAALNGYRGYDSWFITAGLGASYTNEKSDDYLDSTNTRFNSDTLEIGLVNGQAEAAYALTDTFEPYASLAYEYELTDPEAGGKDTLIYGAGFRYQPHETLSIGGSITSQALRDDERVITAGLNARLQF